MSALIGIVGAGAIGGFLAAKLAAAGLGVVVLARGATLSAIRAQGLRVRSATGDVVVRPAAASDDASALGPVDAVVFAVKAYDTAAAGAAMAPMVGAGTRIVSFQNGMTGLDWLADRYGPDCLAPGVTWLPATVEAPGVIRHTGAQRRFAFGPLDGRPAPVLAALADAGARAGLDMQLLPDPRPALWEKLAVLAPFHGLCALTRLPLGGWIDVPEARALFAQAVAEVVSVGRAIGAPVDDGLFDRTLAFATRVADRRTRASMLDDIEAGRPLEVDASLGWLAARAGEAGVQVPALAAMRALLMPRAAGQRA